jgi:hypothetical protein
MTVSTIIMTFLAAAGQLPSIDAKKNQNVSSAWGGDLVGGQGAAG